MTKTKLARVQNLLKNYHLDTREDRVVVSGDFDCTYGKYLDALVTLVESVIKKSSKYLVDMVIIASLAIIKFGLLSNIKMISHHFTLTKTQHVL